MHPLNRRRGSTGFCVSPAGATRSSTRPGRPSHGEIEQPGFYIHAPELGPADSAPFAFLRNQFGFVPGVFRAQTARPDVLEAEVFAIRRILLSEEALSRRQKERILRGCDPSQAT